MRKLIITALCYFLFIISINAQSKVFYVDLKEGKEIPAQPILEYIQNSNNEKAQKIVVYPSIEFQEIEGVGGAFNEIGGLALMSLPQESRENVMRNLFSEDGAQFSFSRTAIGASDFGADAYSYSEVAEDYTMEHFSIEREKKSVLPYIKMAFKYNPKMKLFASPWSPPGWMKSSGIMDQGKNNRDQNKLKDDPKIYKAYALYFSKYVNSYANEGIKIDRILVQNETDANTNYPSNVMQPAQMYHFIQQYLRPNFNKNNMNTEIWAGTFRTHGALDALEFVNTEGYLNAVDGIGLQYTNTNYLKDLSFLAADTPTMHTEGVCYNGKNNMEQAYNRLGEIASYINFGVPNYCYWNMILDETGKSGWNWKQNSLINIDRKNQTVTYNPDYAVIALLSKYMQPGSKRIASFSKETLISIKKEGKVYLFVQNNSDTEKSYECIEAGKTVATATIPSKSVAVIVY